MNYLTSFTEKDSTEDIVNALKSDGGVIIERLVPEEVMDEAYQEVQNNVSQAEQSSSTSLWPEGNRTVGGLAAASLTYTEKLVIHPKTLEIVRCDVNAGRAYVGQKSCHRGQIKSGGYRRRRRPSRL